MAIKPAWIIKGGYTYGFKNTAPTSSDTDYPVGSYIWINITTSIAYVLHSLSDGVATWAVKSPDSVINNGQINVIGESAVGEPVVRISGTATDGITSIPGEGEHKITNLRVDQNGKFVATYEG